MSTKKPIFDHEEMKPGSAPDRSYNLHASGLQSDAVCPLNIVVAVISSNLRSSSATRDGLMKRTLATISVTTELIAHSREVIARSHALFTSHRTPSYRISINASLISMNFHKRGRSLADPSAGRLLPWLFWLSQEDLRTQLAKLTLVVCLSHGRVTLP